MKLAEGLGHLIDRLAGGARREEVEADARELLSNLVRSNPAGDDDDDDDDRGDDDDDDEDRDVDEAAEEYRRSHWGRAPTEMRTVEVQAAPKVLVQLGELEAVIYVTAKGRRVTRADRWHHEFEGEKPILAYDRETKKLFIVGGSYTLTERGIEG